MCPNQKTQTQEINVIHSSVRSTLVPNIKSVVSAQTAKAMASGQKIWCYSSTNSFQIKEPVILVARRGIVGTN